MLREDKSPSGRPLGRVLPPPGKHGRSVRGLRHAPGHRRFPFGGSAPEPPRRQGRRHREETGRLRHRWRPGTITAFLAAPRGSGDPWGSRFVALPKPGWNDRPGAVPASTGRHRARLASPRRPHPDSSPVPPARRTWSSPVNGAPRPGPRLRQGRRYAALLADDGTRGEPGDTVEPGARRLRGGRVEGAEALWAVAGVR